MITDDWNDLTPDQRLEARLDAWQNAPIEFASPEVEEAYRGRVQLYRDALALRKPARVPVAPWIDLLPMRMLGYTARDAYYDAARLTEAWDRFHEKYQPDALASTAAVMPGRMFEILDYRMYEWPGHGVTDEAGYQYVEREWMRADEYDALIDDPSRFWSQTYLPRMFGALEPMAGLAPWTDIVELPFTFPAFLPFAQPEVKEMLRRLMDAGDAAQEFLQLVQSIDGRLTATLGIPDIAGGASKAPYDVLGDTMRGTRGLMLDKFRRPEKVLAACERLVPGLIDWGVRAADANRQPFVFIPIHKGADGFMSDEDYRTLYWPSFKRVLLGLIEQGCVPLVFAEGAYNSRLDVIADPDIPEHRTIWMFDETDMVRARETVGARHCIGGNVPGSLLMMGQPERVDAYVKDLLGKVAADGGFILGTGIVLDEADEACFASFIAAGKKYGAEV